MNIHTEIARIVQLQHTFGCGNHGCRYKKVTGQGTNAGCRCHSSIASRIIDFYRQNRVEFNKQIDFMDNYAAEAERIAQKYKTNGPIQPENPS